MVYEQEMGGEGIHRAGRAMSDEVLYRKVGRRYISAGDFYTNPAEGLWLVKKEPFSQEKYLIARLSELPDFVPLVNLEMRRKEIQKVIADNRQFSSVAHLTTAIFMELSK